MDEDLELAVDSCNYHILTNACAQAAQIHGLSCEIGTRQGGSSYLIMKTFLEANAKRPHVAIDPYGNIDYTHWENSTVKLDYTNQMKNDCLARLYPWCKKHDYNLVFFNLEDTEFFNRFHDGVPIYDENKRMWNEYSLVFLDGPHNTAHVRKEIDFFAPRLSKGGYLVFDDILQYPHMEKLHPYLEELGFNLVESTINKASYVKM